MLSNYNRLARRGTKYVNRAAQNWELRKRRLIGAWVCATLNQPKARRIAKIINAIDVRLSEILKAYREARGLIIELKQAEQNITVNLLCSNYGCEYAFPFGQVRIGMRYSDFKPDESTCPSCGHLLRLKEDPEVDNILNELNIALL